MYVEVFSTVFVERQEGAQMADNVIATVNAVFGTAYARNAAGELRELKPGDVLLENETVVTPDGASVELAMSDGSPLVVADVPELTLTRDLMAETATTREEAEVTDDTVDAVTTRYCVT